ncbi:MAG: M1 family aminopeptidase [Saprospiraceae bacterium]
MKKIFFIALTIAFAWGCKTTQKTMPTTEFRELDTLVISAKKEEPNPDEFKLPVYQATATREMDLLHTKLDVRFDWDKEQVLGKAYLKLKPYFYPSQTVTLDAKNFEFHKVQMEGKDLKYDYDGEKITIHLGKEFKRTEEINLFIDYTATPEGDGGSAAITSDKGLYFINPRGEDPNKPMQIWTQGETESNSRWFPTIDKPNERCTQEMLITVDDKFETLSNGNFISSTKNTDGTRTDYYKMDLPHAPYLFMMAIGEFAVVDDKWRDIPLKYYVEPEFKDAAKDIYPYTPEMLEFFSNIVGYDYPWPSYSQVTVRDYVSGAMENTTGVIFGEFMQKSKEELADNNDQNEQIVAHEMFHHWFGDLVTCESWSNLTLNEGFANYSEYLWKEHKHGRDAADAHWVQEFRGYMGSAKNQGIHDLIDFEYDNREEMFDAHSYNKGGLILHMLRTYVGDDAFFAALKHYLTKNAFSDVEAHELRLAFEDVTGEDLNWFFNQWYFDKGQPKLEVTYDYDSTNQQVNVTVEQTQDPDKMPAIFILPTTIDIYMGPGKKMTKEVRVDQRKQTFTFDVDSKPALVNFDGSKTLLAEVSDNKEGQDYLFQYYNAPTYRDRSEALQALQYMNGEEIDEVFFTALDDTYYGLQLVAIQKVNVETAKVIIKLKSLAAKSGKPQVRAAALSKLAETGNQEFASDIKKALANDRSLLVKASALRALQNLEPETALAEAKKLEDVKSSEMTEAIGEIYANEGDPSNLGFFESRWSDISGFGVISFLETYSDLLSQADTTTILNKASMLKDMGTNMDTNGWLRFAVVNGLNNLHVNLVGRANQSEDMTLSESLKSSDETIKSYIEEIKTAETNPQLKMMYGRYPSKTEKP